MSYTYSTMILLLHFLAYGIFGWAVEILFTGITDSCKNKNWQLKGVTYLWMFPIYGFGGLLFEVVHIYFLEQQLHWLVRFPLYLIGLYLVEFMAGYLLLKLTGNYVWKYEGRYQIAHLVNLAYAPLWIAFLIVFEKLHLLLDAVVILR